MQKRVDFSSLVDEKWRYVTKIRVYSKHYTEETLKSKTQYNTHYVSVYQKAPFTHLSEVLWHFQLKHVKNVIVV